MTPEDLKIKKQEAWEEFFRTADSSKAISKYSFINGWEMCERHVTTPKTKNEELDKLLNDFQKIKKAFDDRVKVIEMQLKDKEVMKLEIDRLKQELDKTSGLLERSNDIAYELGENLKCAEDQNHYFQLMSHYRDKFFDSKKEVDKLKEELNNSKNYHCEHFKSTNNGYIACELKYPDSMINPNKENKK